MKSSHVVIVGLLAAATLTLAGNVFSPHHLGPAQAYPDPSLTPGVVATTDFVTLTATKNGLTYSKNHRLTTDAMKNQICAEYPQNCTSGHEIDHFCPLALGCADDVKNLWAEPEHIVVNGFDYGFHTKDRLETMMVIKMKAGDISPSDAQQCILKDWVACYQKYVGNSLGSAAPATDPDNE